MRRAIKTARRGRCERGAVALLALTSLALSFSAACGDSDATGSGGAGASSSGGSPSVGGSGGSSDDASSSSTGIALGGGGQGGMGTSFTCDPPAAPGSLYELSGESLDIAELEPVSMCRYRGDVLLIVNVAAL